MKREYTAPEMKTAVFPEEDILTASNTNADIVKNSFGREVSVIQSQDLSTILNFGE